MDNTEKEKSVIWRTHPDYPVVQANQFGEIRITDRVVICKNGVKHHYKGHVLKQYINKDGYTQVAFGVNGKQVHLLVHRIVATCFLPNPDNLPQVNHKDSDPANNTVSNLEWCTGEYNNTYREKFGKACSRSVFVVNLKTSEILYFHSQKEAARQLKADRRHINDVLKGLRKQTGGYWFCNVDSSTVTKVRAKFGDEIASKVEELMRKTGQLIC